jgi:hypothetical protein
LSPTFDGPARAIRAASAITDSARRLGLKLQTGLHTGECDVLGDQVGGVAVELATAGCRTSRCQRSAGFEHRQRLVAGSGIRFGERGCTGFRTTRRMASVCSGALTCFSPEWQIQKRDAKLRPSIYESKDLPQMDYSIVVLFTTKKGTCLSCNRRLTRVMESLNVEYELVFVDDGSTDRTTIILKDICALDPRVIGLRLRRNFGQTARSPPASTAPAGDVIIAMDGDLATPA